MIVNGTGAALRRASTEPVPAAHGLTLRDQLLDWPWIVSWILRAILIGTLATWLRPT